MLFYREAVHREDRLSAARLLDVNAGMAGGRAAKERLKALLPPDLR